MGPREGQTATNRRTGEKAVYQGGRWVKMEPGKLTQDQGQAQGYAKLMADAEAAYRDAVARGYNPADIRNAFASVVEAVPLLDGAGALIRDDTADVGRQAELQWSDAQLRAMSGAAAPEGEVRRNVRTYFPRPGENPQAVGPRKQQARQTAFEAARRRAGPAAQEIRPPAPPAQSGPVQVRSVQEAMRLPPGTVFITPDGRRKVR